MQQCWRWFGPADTVKIEQLAQVGVEGVVSALHQFPPGEVWPLADILERQAMIAAPHGIGWDVVESLPVSEAIKTQSSDAKAHFTAYRESMDNLAAAGLKTICYNFMPILDWTRTTLRKKQAHGGVAMQFNLLDFAVFDLFVLKRTNARDDYNAEITNAAKTQFDKMSEAEKQDLQDNTICGLPGANEGWTLDDLRRQLLDYAEIDAGKLRQNLIDFLGEVVPHAEKLGMRLCCHPDDPPFSLMGLPRVMSSIADYKAVLDAVDSPANGATFCTGSLGVSARFDGVEFIRQLGHKIHFAHLRNTKRLPSIDPARPDFFEAPHLEGDTNMVAVVNALLDEETRRSAQGRDDWQIPMRPDHGQDLLDDLNRSSQPGYPLIGRLRGLAELRGIMAAHSG